MVAGLLMTIDEEEAGLLYRALLAYRTHYGLCRDAYYQKEDEAIKVFLEKLVAAYGIK